MIKAVASKSNHLMIFIVTMFLLLPVQASAGLPGDLNRDGTVSISEVQTAINAFLGLIPSDTAAPSTPANLTATAASSSAINLSWTASTDNAGVAGYKVFRGATLLTTATSATFADSGLAAGTSYSYTVSAFDAAGNDSAASLSATASTQAGSAPASSLVGSWYNADGPVVISFIDGSNYMLTHDGAPDAFGQRGIERGTYTFDQTTRAFAVTSLAVDTNGDWGLSDAGNLTLSSDGNSLLENGTAFATKIIKSTSNALVGGWYIPYPDAGQALGPVVITFIDDTNFMMAHDGSVTADPSGQPGMERGTYTWNQSTGVLTANVIADTNGEWGFSNSEPMIVSVDGNTLSAEGVVFSTRIQ